MFEKKLLKGDGRTTMTDLGLNFKLIAAFSSRELNQMTNVPVNTHLIFGPTLCKKKTSFAKFEIVLKWVKVNSGSSFI